jgi:hypothetical protein
VRFDSSTVPPPELPSQTGPIALIAIGGATAVSGGVIMFSLFVKSIMTSEDDLEYDDQGREIRDKHPITPAGVAALALLGTAVITLPVGFIWLRKRRLERRRISSRWKQELQYIRDQRVQVSLVPQASGGRLRIMF